MVEKKIHKEKDETKKTKAAVKKAVVETVAPKAPVKKAKEKEPLKKTAAVKKEAVKKAAKKVGATKKQTTVQAPEPLKSVSLPPLSNQVATPPSAPAVTKEKNAVAKPAAPIAQPVKPAAALVPPVLEPKPKKVKVVRPESKLSTPVSATAAPAKPIAPSPVESVQKPPVAEAKPPRVLKPIELDLPITIKDLAIKIQEKSSVLIKYLIEKQKMFVTINQAIDEEIVKKTLAEFGYEYKRKLTNEEILAQTHETSAGELKPRPPVVTFMGHVDHGKTSLLDAIRRSKVVDTEHGGITQHIGAYQVKTPHGAVTFLDTPGHEAFTAMRARGAQLTDIVVLVVAADDGIMPQTVEAIHHARAAAVPIIVAMNKIDKPTVDIEKVKRQLAAEDLASEDWGGKTIAVGVSAKTGEGIEHLLEMILLEAELLELKAVYNKPASGVVVEARLSKGKGPIATVLVQAGTLRVGDSIICGVHYGKIKAMLNDLGGTVTEATPGTPVEILGLSGSPVAGENFYAVEDEKQLRSLVEKRQEQERLKRLTQAPKHITLEDLYNKIQKGEVKELNLVIKADVQGSLEAIKESLLKIDTKEVQLNILHTGVGLINSSDVILAEASNAIIIGFHVEADTKSQELAEEKKVEIRTYRIIYELLGEMKSALEGLLAPKIKKIFIGRAEIKKVFNLSRSGLIAGCMVTKGKILRQSSVALVRGGETIFEGSLSSLKRFKDDVREVQEGFECGIALAGFTDYKEGDNIEAYAIEKVARTL